LKELSMHILDIVENSVAAGATRVSILVEENKERDVLVIEIRDNGRGMDEAMRRKALDPFVTTKLAKSVGMGLSLFSEASKRSGGAMTIDSEQEKGTTIRATFGLNHVDRQPMGDIVETMVTLVVGNPDVEFHYQYVRDGKGYSWDTEMIRERFGDVSRSNPEVVDFVREWLAFFNMS